jgi:hypothetical protein
MLLNNSVVEKASFLLAIFFSKMGVLQPLHQRDAYGLALFGVLHFTVGHTLALNENTSRKD